MRVLRCAVIAAAVLAPALVMAQGKDKVDAAKAAAIKGGAAGLQQMVAKYDSNGDGKLDDDERTKAAEDLQTRIKEGKLSKQEMALVQTLMTQLQAGGGGDRPQFGGGDRGGPHGFGGPAGGGAGPQLPPDVVKKFDKNKDGKLDEKELKAAMSALGPKKSRSERLQDKLDLNGDGKITPEEREQVAAERKAEQDEKKADAEEKKAKYKKKIEDKKEDKDANDKEEKEDKADKDAKDKDAKDKDDDEKQDKAAKDKK